ncbi:hypothetical protein Pfo_001429 [Paulownia fortunei]|nr:hypothetical protein Pfo_001429 [Paulownia fortunei]
MNKDLSSWDACASCRAARACSCAVCVLPGINGWASAFNLLMMLLLEEEVVVVVMMVVGWWWRGFKIYLANLGLTNLNCQPFTLNEFKELAHADEVLSDFGKRFMMNMVKWRFWW